MNHDPLCPYFPEQQGFGGIGSGVPSAQPYIAGVPCQCDLIARVREDERAAALRDAVEAIRKHVISGYFCSCGAEINSQTGHHAGVIEALGGER